MSARVVLALCLLLLVPSSALAATAEEVVTVSEHEGPTQGRELVLTFKPLRPEPALARFSVEEARVFVEALEADFQVPVPRAGPASRAEWPADVVRAGVLLGSMPDAQPSELERRVRAALVQLHGPSSMALSSTLENSRWFQALKLSPRYMGEGVREAAMELLTSPTVARVTPRHITSPSTRMTFQMSLVDRGRHVSRFSSNEQA